MAWETNTGQHRLRRQHRGRPRAVGIPHLARGVKLGLPQTRTQSALVEGRVPTKYHALAGRSAGIR
jgi:hypothetical protein